VRDAKGQALAYIYSRENEAMAPSVMRGLPAFQTAGMAALGTTRTSRSRPDMSVHWGEAVKMTPRLKWGD